LPADAILKHPYNLARDSDQAPLFCSFAMSNTPKSTFPTKVANLAVVIAALSMLQGCAVVAVADAAVTVVATGVKVTAKAVGAVADAVIPDSKPAK
jgi:hypothetical protein